MPCNTYVATKIFVYTMTTAWGENALTGERKIPAQLISVETVPKRQSYLRTHR